MSSTIDRKIVLTMIVKEINENKMKREPIGNCVYPASRRVFKRSISEAHRSFMETLGEGFMAFPEFEKLYMKLEKGEECDVVDDERPILHLYNLPNEMIASIIDRMSTEEKWMTRESLENLRPLVDCRLPKFENLSIGAKPFAAYECVEFSKNGIPDFKIKFKNRGVEDQVYLVGNDGAIEKFSNNRNELDEGMVGMIQAVVEATGTRLLKLSIYFPGFVNSALPELLTPVLDEQSQIRDVFIHSGNSLASEFSTILERLRPETLEVISLKGYNEGMDLSEIVELEQWQMAKKCELMMLNAVFPISGVVHLEDFLENKTNVDAEYVEMIVNRLVQGANVKKWKVHTRELIDFTAINQQLGALNELLFDRPQRRHFNIEDSNEFIRMEIDNSSIEFTRQSSFQ